MSPTRRDTLKAAGAASGLAMLGGHAVAQRDGTEGDGPGAQTLEEGQAAVRFGYFVPGAPAVNVWLVPSDGSGSSETDSDEIGGSGTDDSGTGNETGGMGENTSGGNTSGGNTSGGNTSEDLQFGNDTNESDAGNQTGGMGGNATDGNATGNETDGGVGTTPEREGLLIAENVSFSEVSDYANVQAGDYTIQLVEVTSGDTTDTGSGTAGNETGGMGGNTSGGNTSEDLQFGNDTNGSDAGNGTGDNATGNGSGGDGNDSDDGMFSGGILDDVGGDGSDDNVTGGMADNETGGMADNETGGTGGNATGNGTGGVGTTDDATGGEVIFEEEITVGETYYTVAAAGSSVDEIDLHLLRDYDAAQVRLVHAAPDAPGVDVVAPDANMTLFDDVTFGQATDYVGVPPGSYSLSVREATDMNDGSEVGAFDVEVESGQAYSVYAVGSPSGGEEEFDLVVLQDGQGADAGLGQDGAPGQQGEPGDPGASGNETGGPSGDGPPGQDNETGGPGRSAGAGGGRGRGNATDATGTDEPGGPGGAAGPNDPGNGSGGNASGNDSDDGDGGGILSF